MDISQPERCAWYNFKNTRPKVFCKKGVLKNSQNSEEKSCVRVYTCAGLMPATLLSFSKFLRTPFYIEHLWWLLLKVFCLCYITVVNTGTNNRSLEDIIYMLA